MKLLRFSFRTRVSFGLAVEGRAVSFEKLAASAGRALPPSLLTIDAYLQNLPASFTQAKELHDAFLKSGRFDEHPRLDEVKILAPLAQPAALIDFGLTPKHLADSAKVLLRHEFGPVIGPIAAFFIGRGVKRKAKSPILMYYKGNHLTVIGDDDEMGWPEYSSYLDIEPELAFVTGGENVPVAGYLIFNDASARDIQFPEMIGTGPARAKDFVRGNGLGPFLVTPDEIPNPLDLKVTAKVGERFVWQGHTSEITHHPETVAAYLRTVYPSVPGIVVGLGTIPGCTGLDNDLWIRPHERIEISIEGLGTLHQRVPAAPKGLQQSRWKARPDLLPPPQIP